MRTGKYRITPKNLNNPRGRCHAGIINYAVKSNKPI